MILLSLIGAAACGLMLVWIFSTHPRLAWLLGLALFLLEAIFGAPAGVNVGFVRVYPEDALWVAALLALFFVEKSDAATKLRRLLVTLLLLTALMTLAGSWLNGPVAAVAEMRVFLYFFAAALYCASVPQLTIDARWFLRTWLLLAGILSLIAVIHWSRYGVGTSSSALRSIPSNKFFVGGLRDARALRATEALVILQAAAIAWFGGGIVCLSGFVRKALSAWFLVVVLLLQHRTIWVALVAGIICAAFWPSQDAGRSSRRAAALIAILTSVAVGFVAAALRLGVTSNIANSSSAAFDQDSTFVWRYQSWVSLLTQSRSVLEWLFGTPFGAGYARIINVGQLHGVVDVNPHSFYVQVLLRLGLIGVLFLLRVYILALRASARDDSGAAPLTVFVCVTGLVLFATYPPSYDQGMLLGISAALIMTRTSREQYAPSGMHDDAQSSGENHSSPPSLENSI